MKIEIGLKERVRYIQSQILPQIFYEFMRGAWTRQESLESVEEWYRRARGLISQYDLDFGNRGYLIIELNENYRYYKDRIDEVNEKEIQYHQDIYY